MQPRIMEQVVACKDDIAQQYLMQCVIQCFPDEFHLGTLDALLGTLPQLQPGVKVHVVLSSLLDRLARSATTSPACAAPSSTTAMRRVNMDLKLTCGLILESLR